MTTRGPFFLPVLVRDTSVSSVLPLIHRQERSPVKNERVQLLKITGTGSKGDRAWDSVVCGC